MLMIRAKLMLQMLQMPLHTHPSHQDEPFQSIGKICHEFPQKCHSQVTHTSSLPLHHQVIPQSQNCQGFWVAFCGVPPSATLLFH